VLVNTNAFCTPGSVRQVGGTCSACPAGTFEETESIFMHVDRSGNHRDFSLPKTIVAAVPALACGPVQNMPANSVALILRGACDFVDKIRHARDAGAIGVVIYNVDDNLLRIAPGDILLTPVTNTVGLRLLNAASATMQVHHAFPTDNCIVLLSIRALEAECVKCTVGTYSEQVAATSNACSNCPYRQTSPAASNSVANCICDSDHFQLESSSCVCKTGLGGSPACTVQDGCMPGQTSVDKYQVTLNLGSTCMSHFGGTYYEVPSFTVNGSPVYRSTNDKFLFRYKDLRVWRINTYGPKNVVVAAYINSVTQRVIDGTEVGVWCNGVWAAVPGALQKNTIGHTCVTCEEGKYKSTFDKSACVECAEGKYYNKLDPSHCLACSENRHSPRGSVYETDCEPCPLHASLTGGTSICECNAGRTMNVHNECLLCQAGSHKIARGNHACSLCAEGKFKR